MAIGFDSKSSGGQSAASSDSFAHTCIGSNVVLIVTFVLGASRTITSVQFNGQDMTLIDSQLTTNAFTYMYYLIVGTGDSTPHNVVISFSGGNTSILDEAISYTGVNQASPIDAHNKAASSSLTLTVVSANCWITATAGDAAGVGLTYSAGSGFTLRENNRLGSNGQGVEDSNGTVSAGGNTVAFSLSSGGTILTVVAASLNPVNNFTRSMSDSIMNSASRTVTVSRVASYGRALSDSIMNSVGRLVFLITSGRVNLTSLRPSVGLSMKITPRIE